MDVIFPKSFRAGVAPVRFRVEDAQVHLRADAEGAGVRPTIESVSLLLVVMGVTVGFEQTIRYTRFRSCSQVP